ncbi:MAG: NADAR family protein [Endozoicomonadaceae bacterium]|nr:NADAR family protein [Endozoicomonadaceae bacterium]
MRTQRPSTSRNAPYPIPLNCPETIRQHRARENARSLDNPYMRSQIFSLSREKADKQLQCKIMEYEATVFIHQEDDHPLYHAIMAQQSDTVREKICHVSRQMFHSQIQTNQDQITQNNYGLIMFNLMKQVKQIKNYLVVIDDFSTLTIEQKIGFFKLKAMQTSKARRGLPAWHFSIILLNSESQNNHALFVSEEKKFDLPKDFNLMQISPTPILASTNTTIDSIQNLSDNYTTIPNTSINQKTWPFYMQLNGCVEFYDRSLPNTHYLSNTFATPFILNDIQWSSVEAYFQCQKLSYCGLSTHDYQACLININQATTGGQAKETAYKIFDENPYDKKKWQKNSLSTLYLGIQAKFNQNYNLKEKLMETYPCILVEKTDHDRFYGSGKITVDDNNQLIYNGKNATGILLMIYRKTLICNGT